jgi:futalosine hydrolase
MKVVLTSATEKEIVQIKQHLPPSPTNAHGQLQLSFHVSGVGILVSSFSIAKLIFKQKPDLIIQTGIAGTFDQNHPLGTVITIKDEILADTGVEENGSFKDVFDLNLENENVFPFNRKKLTNLFIHNLNLLQLQPLTGVTVNEITTRKDRIELLKAKYSADIESMEGASLHYACLQTSTPFIQIRAISNYIGERDKSKWNFRDAFKNLSSTVIKYIAEVSSINDLEEHLKEKNNEIYNRI